jgi:uncharacterized protein (TIGR03000 family)
MEGTSMPTPAVAPTLSSSGSTGGTGTPTPAAPAKTDATPTTPLVPPVDKPVTPPAGGIPNLTPPVPEGSGVIPSTPKSTSIEPTAAETGVLTVWVPNEAKVTINGMLTKSTGSKRHFVSYGLRPGYTYKYVVKAEIVREGKIVTEEQTVALTAGDRNGVAFGFNEAVAQNE